uniref:Uncharacterized protein n=1 Tax=Ciona intestinalis TaxID=7719 RepID=H2XLS4_CIOIN
MFLNHRSISHTTFVVKLPTHNIIQTSCNPFALHNKVTLSLQILPSNISKPKFQNLKKF